MKTCTIEGCERPYYGKGFCNMHYSRNRTHGDPHVVSRNCFPPATCSVPGCDRPHVSRGLCVAHRNRLQRTGNVRADVPVGASNTIRFWAKVSKSEDCWEWQGARTRHGHGQFGSGNRVVYAHRFAYEQLVSELPANHVLHHLCESPSCVNPAHLQAMTQSEHAALHMRLRFPAA